MAASKELLTVDVVRDWLRNTLPERAQKEAEVRAVLIDRALSVFAQHIEWGLSVQDAGDAAWRMRGKHVPGDVRPFVIEALEAMGWRRRSRGEKQ